MSRRKQRRLDQAGQSTLEFALTLVLLLGFILFFFQFAMMSAFGSYTHYATFMAARAYLAAGRDPGEQEERARSVLTGLVKRSANQPGVDRFPMIARGEGGTDTIKGAQFGGGADFTPSNDAKTWQEGVRYSFKSRLFLLPFGGSASGGDELNSLILTSESWLGREPTEDECLQAMQPGWLIDNGC